MTVPILYPLAVFTMNNNTILTLDCLDKTYPGGIHAVKKLSFKLNDGSICALLGPNGAGKSTVIGMICGLCKPSGGSLYFRGAKVAPDSSEYRSKIGVVSQHLNLELDLSAWQNLKIHALLYGMGKREREERIESLLTDTGLIQRGNDPVRSFSGGMKRKLQIIRALLHNPELIILDEPTVGLDPATREGIWDIIYALNQDGKTILFSTHYMEEAERNSQRVAIIHQGRIIRDNTSSALIKELGAWCLIDYIDGIKQISFFPDRKTAVINGAERSSRLVIRETTLEDLFIYITGSELDRKESGK